MPTYVYECPTCKVQVELVQKVNSRVPPQHCDLDMLPVIGKTSFMLKGPGWAKDGYSKK